MLVLNQFLGALIVHFVSQKLACGYQTANMPNFNTTEMKIAFKRASTDPFSVKRLPSESIRKLLEALVYAVSRAGDQTLVVAFDGYYIHSDDFKLIAEELNNHGAAICTSTIDSINIRTEGNQIISVKLSGGSPLLPCPPGKESGDAANGKPPVAKGSRKRRHESIENEAPEPIIENIGALTQECSGLY